MSEIYGVSCGLCDGGVYMETCGIDGCEWVVAGECQNCGERTPHKCPDHPQTPAVPEEEQ